MKQTIISGLVAWIILMAICTPTLIIPTVILKEHYGTWAIIYPIAVFSIWIICVTVSSHLSKKRNAWRMKP